MRYKEFAKKLAELDLYVERRECKQIYIYTSRQVALAIVDDSDQYDLYFSGKCRTLSPEVREKFFSLAVEYASTPIEKRKSEPKDELKYNVIAFRRKRGTINNMSEDVGFYYRTPYGRLDWTFGMTNNAAAQQWTLEQIKEWGLEDCERVEAKGDRLEDAIQRI